ncbi:unnamed protein product, partial [Didymodactylos carnosus]
MRQLECLKRQFGEVMTEQKVIQQLAEKERKKMKPTPQSVNKQKNKKTKPSKLGSSNNHTPNVLPFTMNLAPALITSNFYSSFNPTNIYSDNECNTSLPGP